jgi:uroporphyrinogen decarboxylase
MMTAMTHRERLLTALSHRQPDRVPLDLGGSMVSSITAKAYDKLKAQLGLDIGPTRIFDRMNQLAVVDDVVLDLLEIDTRGVAISLSDDSRKRVAADETDEYIDTWGLQYRIKPGHDTYFVANAPLKGEITTQDIINYPWPDPDDPRYTDGLRERVIELRQKDERAIVLSLPGSIIQMSQLLRGFSEWFLDVALEPERLETLIDQVMEIQMALHGNILAAVGEVVDVVFFFDDIAMQDRMIVSPADFDRFIEPRLCKYVEFLRSKTNAKIVYHTDGAVAPVLDRLADWPIDAINPVQVSAKGMGDVAALKQQAGDRLTFWGGVDTQVTLPNGTPEEVGRETESRIRDLNQNGGYVLGAVHTIQGDVPPENILAMFGAALGKRFN